jgi:Fe-S-cluster containining protein
MDDLTKLYAAVDRLAARLANKHGSRLQCGRGCAACCVDELTVFEIEARNIREHQTRLLQNEVPHPAGACAFLGADKSCRIYETRP